MEWFDDAEPGEAKQQKHKKTVVLMNMFTLEELDQDPSLLLDLKHQVREECEKLGPVGNVSLFDVLSLM